MQTVTDSTSQLSLRPQWGAVIAMMLGVFSLVTAEFLPVSLLTPMADDLKISESLAGQAISTTALFAIFSSLVVPWATRRYDRRSVLLCFTVLLILANLIVAMAPDFILLLAGRILLGIALGGFWAMSTAIVIRLVPPENVTRALAITVSGVAAAMLCAGPLASYLNHISGWRTVFFLAAGLGVAVFFTQYFSLPALPPKAQTSSNVMLEVLARPGVKPGLLAALLVFAGHMMLFSYIRPFLEQVEGISAASLSTILLVFGLASYAGTWLSGLFPPAVGKVVMGGAPLLIAAVALALGSAVNGTTLIAILTILWGLAFGTVPTTWSNWVADTVPDEAESAGGLLVAVINVAIASGAGIGGLILNYSNVLNVYLCGAYVLLIACLHIVFIVRPRIQPVTTCPAA